LKIRALWLLQKDYARLAKFDGDAGWLRIYVQTFRDSTFGTVFVYRILSGAAGRKVAFHTLRLLMRLFVPQRRDIELSPLAQIGEGLVIYHGSGLVIGAGVVVGKNLTVEHGVTVGNRIGSSIAGAAATPVIGNNCLIGCGAAVLGPVKLGDDVKIGANAVVLTDVPDRCTAVGVPARILP
jgi:serine acetyltransferase